MLLARGPGFNNPGALINPSFPSYSPLHFLPCILPIVF